MAEREYYISGFLKKRQRGQHIQREAQRKNLKFQDRYCTLSEHSFTYSKKKNVSCDELQLAMVSLIRIAI